MCGCQWSSVAVLQSCRDVDGTASSRSEGMQARQPRSAAEDLDFGRTGVTAGGRLGVEAHDLTGDGLVENGCVGPRGERAEGEIGRASCRERV